MTADHQLALWIAHPVVQLAVAAAMVRNKVRRSFPVFFGYPNAIERPDVLQEIGYFGGERRTTKQNSINRSKN